MRKSRQETEATRKRIVKSASEAFRENGIAETGLKDLMQGAGLATQGGFYKHFGSKEELVTEAISLSIAQILERMETSVAATTSDEAVERLVTTYLSPIRRDRVSDACPFSALGSELRRTDAATREVTAAGLRDFIALIAKVIKDVPPKVARKRATAIVSAMVGGVILSRIADDSLWSDSILKDTSEFILRG